MIWRWGRQNATRLTRGKPPGSFEIWAEWCRDPLVTLGCCDPVERIEALKANDPRRQRIGELFRAWWEHHGALPTKASDLAEPVKAIADPQGRGRQYLATFLIGIAGTHAAGFVLTRQEPGGKWSAATYALNKTVPPDTIGHTYRPDGASPIGPMGPMPDALDGAIRPGAERKYAGYLVGRRRCRTAAAGYTVGSRRALRRVIRTPSSMDATRPRRLQAGARSRRSCRR
jgi:hypothetical protein